MIPEDTSALIERHAGRGILLDANLLIVVFVGLWRPGSVGQRVTGDKYGERDFHFLARLVEKANPWILTPHLLTEVDNRLDKIQTPGNLECRLVTARLLERQLEVRPRAIKLVQEDAYSWLGLADAAIIRTARKHACLVLTSDGELYAELCRLEQAAVYYPVIRQAMLLSG